MKQSKRLDVTDHQRMVVFVNGLPSDIKEFVLLQNPDSLESALKLAKTKEVVCTNVSDSSNKTVLNKILKKLDHVANHPSSPLPKPDLNTSAVNFSSREQQLEAKIHSLESQLHHISQQLSSLTQHNLPPVPLKMK